MLLLALAIAPGLAICIYVFYRDVHDREPALNLVMSFFWGMATIVPAILVEWTARALADRSIAGVIISAFLLVGLVEELSKFLALRYYSFTRRSFDEPLDGIIYSVMVSMGFATLENVMYSYIYGMSTALMRMFTAVPAHATFAVIMGYYVGKAKFDFVQRKKLFLKAIVGATLAHGFYDAFLFFIENDRSKPFVSQTLANILLFSGAIFSLMVAIIFSRRLTRLHRLTSHKLYKNPPVLTIRHAGRNDIEMIRTLALQIWPKTYASILSAGQIRYMMNLMYSKAALLSQMEKGDQFIIVFNAGVPIGFASYGEIEPAVYKLHKIYLLSKQQGRGTGRFVIDQIILDILPKGARALRLNVNRNNPAKNFYEKLGFEITRTEDIDIGGGFFMNDFIMEKKIGEESLGVEGLGV